MATIGEVNFQQDNMQNSRKRKQSGAGHIIQRNDNPHKAIVLDSLPWAQVPLPDHLENAEGFFGLEEISDVEVVKESKTGKLEYKVGKRNYHGDSDYKGLLPSVTKGKFKRNCFEPLRDSVKARICSQKIEGHELSADDEEEWQGFGDAGDGEKSLIVHSPEVEAPTKKAILNLKLEYKRGNLKARHEGFNDQSSQTFNTFQILDNTVDEEADGTFLAIFPLGLITDRSSVRMEVFGPVISNYFFTCKIKIYLPNTNPIVSYSRDT